MWEHCACSVSIQAMMGQSDDASSCCAGKCRRAAMYMNHILYGLPQALHAVECLCTSLCCANC